MKFRRQFLRTSLGSAVAGGLALTRADQLREMQTSNSPLRLQGDAAPEIWREKVLLGFGTKLWLGASHADAEVLERALTAAVDRLRHIEGVMSLFRHDSAVSRLNREGVLLAPDADLLAVLQLAQQVSWKSQGRFDVTIQPLWTMWNEALQAGRMPSEAQISQALKSVGYQYLLVSPERIQMTRRGAAVSLNGIAQGYAADQAKAVLASFGIQHALLDAGEWTSLGVDSNRLPWEVAVQHPALDVIQAQPRIALSGKSLATSSDDQTSFSPDHRYHHIFDPSSGVSPAMAASVTVVADSCALADALTKVFFMAAASDFSQWQSRAEALCEEWNVAALIVSKTGRYWSSSGLV